MDWFTVCLELIGTAAFAESGALTALRKKMDLLGVLILGLTTAVGGGILRDVLLGITPPSIFSDPVTVCVALAASAAAFLPPVRRKLRASTLHFERLMLVADSLGLGIFTVVGAQVAYRNMPEGSWFAVAFLAAVTGVGGGVLRDILAGDVPYIFRKHIYALAALGGAGVWIICHLLWQDTAALLLGAAAVVVIRLLAAHFRWSLPRAKEFDA